MELVDFIDWAFKAMLAGGLYYGVRILSKMQQSIASLNTNVAILLERDVNKGKQIEDHEERLRSLERINAR